MELKVFLLCFALVVITSSAAPGCKRCGPGGKNVTVSKYKVKINDGGKEYVEEIVVDTKKQTETFHIPKMNSSNAGEVDVIYDFKNNLAMRRMADHKSCFLSNSTQNIPKPDELKSALDKLNTLSFSLVSNSTDYEYEVVGTVSDRSSLSDEMAALCAKFPIYRIKKKNVDFSVDKQNGQYFDGSGQKIYRNILGLVSEPGGRYDVVFVHTVQKDRKESSSLSANSLHRSMLLHDLGQPITTEETTTIQKLRQMKPKKKTEFN